MDDEEGRLVDSSGIISPLILADINSLIIFLKGA
tara:strand:- start:412 stop:513 length:102 start_codon:yes stop_codon:yes gene_type:complete